MQRAIAKMLVDLIKVNEGLIPNPTPDQLRYQMAGPRRRIPYPDKIEDYKADDKRRRMVSLIWNVLPGSLYIEGVNAEVLNQQTKSE